MRCRGWISLLSKAIKVGLSDLHRDMREIKGLIMWVEGKSIAGRGNSQCKSPEVLQVRKLKPRELR